MKELRAFTYFDLYEKNASYRGNDCAIHFKGKDTSYSELFSQTQAFASGIRERELKTGSRIAVLCSNHPVFFHLFGAAAALNIVLVLINRRLSSNEITHIIEDTSPEAIFCDPGTADQAKTLMQKSSSLKHCFTVDPEDPSFSELYSHPALNTPVPVTPTDPYLIIHTAAVQGRPRGAVLSQNNVILSNQLMIQAYHLDCTKTYLNILPLFHIMGINLGLGTLQAGGKNVIQEKFDPAQALELIQDQQINLFGSFPPILTSLMDAHHKKRFDLSSLELTVGLEVPDTAKEWETRSGSTFWTLYGQTETSGIVSTAPYFEKTGSAGRILPLANVKVADDAGGQLEPEKTGEILLRGPLVFQGYWNETELNDHTFRQGWHHTGDLGMVDPDGFLFFKGRKPEKELIKPGGENVFPAEVEMTILEHEAVNEVCVFGVPDPKFGEGIKAVCSLKKGFKLTKEELIRFCSQRIAGYKKPRYVQFIDTLPKTDDHGIDRETIKKEYT